MRHSRKTPNETVDADLRAGLRLHKAGHVLEAAAIYEGVLRQRPSNCDALYLLGKIALETGHCAQAIALIQAAINSNPAIAEFHQSLGWALHRSGRVREALACFDKALLIDPSSASGHFNKGWTLEQLDDLAAAAESYRKASEIDSTILDAHVRSGVVMLKLGRPDEAIEACKRAISLKPDSAEAHFNLGHAFEAKEQFDIAAASYREAIRLNPRLAEAHNNLGNALRKLGDVDGALSAFSAAVSLKADFAVALYNLATALFDKKEFQAAIQHYQTAVSLKPEFADAYYNLGNAYRELEHWEQARLAYARALSIRPDFAICYTALGMALSQAGSDEKSVMCYQESLRLDPNNADTYFGLANALQEQNRLKDAVSCLEKALELRPTFKSAFSGLLFQHATTGDIRPEEQHQLAERWECCALDDDERRAARKVTFRRTPSSGRKLRLGFLSAEIGQHAVSEFLEPFLAEIDHNQFHVTLFPSFLRPEPRASRIRSLADAVIPILNLSDRAAAELIRGSEIDVLVETTGHTRHCRLGVCAYRAAPVQVSYIGYWSTTGLTEMDWMLGDCDMPDYMKAHFRERIWRLPRIGVCYRGDPSIPQGEWQPSAEGTIWLGSFNRYIKIREAALALWAKVMHALPESKLLLEDRKSDCSEHHNRILRCLGEHGIAPDRIHFETFIPGHERHMRLYDRLDIALDTIPFNSGTTACDALWMGVPLVAIEGNWAGGRMAASILRAAGMSSWVARGEDEFVSIVTRLARDISGREKLRLIQRDQLANSELCDSKGLTRALQDALVSMFDEYYARNGSRTDAIVAF